MCPYHWHFGEEEWLLVVAGAPTLRTPDGERELRAGDLVAFNEGDAGAHTLYNRSGAPFRVAMFSTLRQGSVVYPDSGKVGVFAGWSRKDGQRVSLMNRPEANLDYFEGER